MNASPTITESHPTRRTRSFGSKHSSIIASLILGGCAAIPPVGEPGNELAAGPVASDEINWPEAYRPEDSTFFVHNEIEIAASAETVWNELIAADSWPSWYRGATDLSVEQGNEGRLTSDASIRWRTMGLKFVSRVTEFEPPYRLSWESRKGLIKGYHAWLIIPTGDGVRVVTDEAQHGFLAHMQKIFIPGKLRRLHDEWLEGLKVRAEASQTTSGTREN